MIEKILKAVKSSNKKRGRNITVGAVVGFLLSCTAVMGADENYLLIKKEGEEVKFSKNGTTAGTDNPYEENTWDGVDYVNNIVLNSTSNSYGLKLEGDLGSINFTNNGLITTTRNSESFGINNSLYATIGNITNNGSIVVIGNGYSYGINNYGAIGNITNNGSITANGSSDNYGINNGGTIGNITNNGSIIGEAPSSNSYGIYNNVGTIGILTNNGSITAESTGDAISGYGINNYGAIGNITNNGSINGSAKARDAGDNCFGVGIYNSETMGDITNNGSITAESIGSYSEASGINNSYGTIEDITNTGSIKAESTGEDSSGYGIYNLKYSGVKIKTIEKIRNIGVIYGKTNAIYNSNDTIINEANNYGLLVSGDSTENVVDGISIVAHNDAGGQNKINNYGLAFTADGSGSYKNGGVSNTNHDFGKTQNATIDGAAYKIRNVEADVNNSTGAITNIKSFKIEDGELYSDTTKINDSNSTSNVILNGIENALKVVGTGNNILTNSIINAYETAVKFDETNGGKLTLSGTTVNGGIDGISAAIFGSDDSSNTDALVLENSVINGNIDMQSGTNTITAGNNTTINGDVKGGAGEDTFTSGNNVAINGKIELGDGNNKITLGNNVYINGDVDMGANGVNLTGGSEVYLNGKVAFTDNVDILTLGEKSVIVQDIAMKDGNDELTIGAGSIVNGKLDGGDDDTLTFGTNSVASPASITKNNMEDSMNISHDITGFENINVGTKVTFASDLSITGANNIALEKDGVLLLTLDKNDLDSGKIR